MDQLEIMPQIKPCDINEFERFADLVCVTVVKLKAENHQGQLENGSLHSMLVKKLSDRHLEMYSRWLGENSREQSVISLSDHKVWRCKVYRSADVMSVGELQNKNDCAFIALVMIIKVKIVKGRRDVELIGATLATGGGSSR